MFNHDSSVQQQHAAVAYSQKTKKKKIKKQSPGTFFDYYDERSGRQTRPDRTARDCKTENRRSESDP